ncbi:MAG: hypothetical protein IJY32_06745 [Mogibacterium sp.]|nr:hypothetical protein [Mogibacterium sp.]
MIYKETLERMREELCERRDDLCCEMDGLPDGNLKCVGKGKKRKYYQRLPVKGYRKKERCYGIKKKPEILYGLVRKRYITKALPVIERDLKAIDSALRWFRPADEDSVMENFTAKYPELADGIYRYIPDVEEWKNAFRPMDDFHPENLKAVDLHGTRKRSNTELYIASRLDHYGLVYRHDCPTGIPGLYRYPDFQILRPRDLKKIYWEHFGMMDDLEYFIDYKRKMEEYEKFGIVPWDNLIITYGNSKSGIDGRMIESLIRAWLL